MKAAQDVQQLSQLRGSLRERMLASPLCDARTFVNQLEDNYCQLWRLWVGGGPPAP